MKVEILKSNNQDLDPAIKKNEGPNPKIKKTKVQILTPNNEGPHPEINKNHKGVDPEVKHMKDRIQKSIKQIRFGSELQHK